MHPGASPQPFRAMPNQPRGPNMPPAFQPQMHPNSPYRANRSPAITPAAIHQQANYTGYNYPQQPFPQPASTFSKVSVTSPVSEASKPAQPVQAPRTQVSSHHGGSVLSTATKQPTSRQLRSSSSYGSLFEPINPSFSSKYIDEQFLTEVLQTQAMYGPPQGLDPYNGYYGQNYPAQNYGMAPGMHYSGVPASPGRGGYPQQAYPVPGYGQPPQAQVMSRTPSNMSERPPSAAQQPSTPAMTNVSHVSQTPSAPSGSPAPGSSFSIPPKTKSKAIVVSSASCSMEYPLLMQSQIKTADGQVVDFNNKKPASPAQPPAPSKSPAIVATPTPPPRPESTHNHSDSVSGKSASDVKAEFVKQFQQQLQHGAGQKEEEDKKKAAEEKEAEEKAQKEKEEAEAAAKAEAEKAAKEKEAAEAAKSDEEEAKRKAEEEKRKADEEMERKYFHVIISFRSLTMRRYDRRDGAR